MRLSNWFLFEPLSFGTVLSDKNGFCFKKTSAAGTLRTERTVRRKKIRAGFANRHTLSHNIRRSNQLSGRQHTPCSFCSGSDKTCSSRRITWEFTFHQQGVQPIGFPHHGGSGFGNAAPASHAASHVAQSLYVTVNVAPGPAACGTDGGPRKSSCA